MLVAKLLLLCFAPLVLFGCSSSSVSEHNRAIGEAARPGEVYELKVDEQGRVVAMNSVGQRNDVVETMTPAQRQAALAQARTQAATPAWRAQQGLPPIQGQTQTPYSRVVSPTPARSGVGQSLAAIDFIRNASKLSDAMASSVGLDPRAIEYETHYRHARESGAQPTEAHWQAQKDMRNMQIFRDGGIPPNF